MESANSTETAYSEIRSRARQITVGIACCGIAASMTTSALGQLIQDEGAGPTTIEFSFSNPGARSMGLGGAFAALADDATAAYANPAGLIQLTRSEVSVEGRLWQYSTPFTEGGRVTGEPTGIGLDTSPGLRFVETNDDVSGLSFLSFTYPKKNWALALYRHELANFKSNTETQGFFADGQAPGVVRRFLDRRIETDFQVVSLGLSAAYRWTEDLSIGVGFSYAEIETISTFDTFLVDDPILFEGFFDAIGYLPERRVGSFQFGIDEGDMVLNLGLLWRASPRWSLGSFFREGPAYVLDISPFVTGPGLELAGIPEGTVLRSERSTQFLLPDIFGLAVAYRTDDGRMTVSLEWDWVKYSSITDGFDPRVIDRQVQLSDATEIHVGFEYVIARSQPVVALRLGAWLDPDHRFHWDGDDNSDAEAFSRAQFASGGDDEIHFAAGAGIVFQGIQIDLALDVSELRNTASLSAIYSF